MNDPAEIVPLLFLGSRIAANNRDLLISKGIKYIINAAVEIPNYFHEENYFTYYRLDLDDDSEVSIASHLEGVISVIHKASAENVGVLVHCQAGISRSATYVIYYLMKVKGMTLKDAYEHTKGKRYNIGPNVGFMSQLVELEKQLFNSNSMDSKTYFLQTLCDMGFDSQAAAKALEQTQYNFDLAVNYLLSQ